MSGRNICENVFRLTKMADYLSNVNMIKLPNNDEDLFSEIFNAAIVFEQNSYDELDYLDDISKYAVDVLMAKYSAI